MTKDQSGERMEGLKTKFKRWRGVSHVPTFKHTSYIHPKHSIPPKLPHQLLQTWNKKHGVFSPQLILGRHCGGFLITPWWLPLLTNSTHSSLHVANREFRGGFSAHPHLPSAITWQLRPRVRVQPTRFRPPGRLPVSLSVWIRECERH